VALADWTKPAPADLLPLVHDGVVFAGDSDPAYGVHHLALPLFREALRRLAPLIPGGLVTPGCWGYADRAVTGGTSPSYHAYGLAIDVNAPTNPYISPTDYAAGEHWAPHTIPDNAGDLVADLGLQWGGRWDDRKDYMHFELHLTPEQAVALGRRYPVDVLDYSSGWPAAAAMTAGGFLGAVRYIGTPGRGKNLTRTEAQALLAGGRRISLVFEDAAGWMRGGAAAGAAAARAALADAANCGVGVRCIYFACDEDVTDAQTMQTVEACLDGAAGVLGRGRTGVYGEADVIDACLAAGHAVWGWQTRAWSGGRVSARAHLLQQIGYVSVGGVQCDRSTILRDDWGQWPMEDDVTAEEVWALPIPYPAWGTAPHSKDAYTAGEYMAGTSATLGVIQAAQTAQTRALAALAGQVSAVTNTLAQLAANAGGAVDYAQVRQAAEAGAEAALAHLRLVSDDTQPAA
jgi:hypothetical protein